MASSNENTQAEVATPESEQQLKNRLRNQAERKVLDNHREEFITEVEALFGQHGLTYNRRLTAEEKAEREMDRLLQEHPALAKRFNAQG